MKNKLNKKNIEIKRSESSIDNKNNSFKNSNQQLINQSEKILNKKLKINSIINDKIKNINTNIKEKNIIKQQNKEKINDSNKQNKLLNENSNYKQKKEKEINIQKNNLQGENKEKNNKIKEIKNDESKKDNNNNNYKNNYSLFSKSHSKYDKDRITINNIKSINSQKNDNLRNSLLKKTESNTNKKELLITEEKMKEMLKGEKHIPEHEIQNQEENNKSNKKIKIIHPNEYYLKEKIKTLKTNLSESLISNINKELYNQMNLIKKEFNDNIPIRINKENFDKLKSDTKEGVKSFTNSISPKSISLFPVLNNINIEDKFLTKKNRKILCNLKKEENNLKKNLIKLNENEKILLNEGELNDFSNNSNKFKVEHNLKMKFLKSIKTQKENILEKVKLIDLKINNFISNDMSDRLSKNEILKNYIQNFEHDKEISEILSQKYLKDSQKREKRIRNNINLLKEKRIKEINLKEKEAEKEKEEILFNFKNSQKALELKQLKENEKKMLECKPYIREKPEKKINTYLFKINQKNFLLNQKKLLINENKKRKEYMKSINQYKINEFAQNFDEKKVKNNEENKSKKKELIKEWKKRKTFLPTYKSLSFEIYEKDLKEKNKMKENIKVKKENLINLKKNYSQQIKEQLSPIIDKKLIKKRIDLIKLIESPKTVKNKNNYITDNKKDKNIKIILKKIDPSKPSKYKWKLKLEEDAFDKKNNSDMDMRYLIKRPKKYIYSALSQNKCSNMKNDIINNEKKENNIPKGKIRQNIWNKIIENNKKDFLENISDVKKEAENLTKKAIKGEQLLKKSGGIKNNLDLGKKVSSFLIDSIEAKLSILNKLGK